MTNIPDVKNVWATAGFRAKHRTIGMTLDT